MWSGEGGCARYGSKILPPTSGRVDQGLSLIEKIYHQCANQVESQLGTQDFSN
jgi:hypothetical protein